MCESGEDSSQSSWCLREISKGVQRSLSSSFMIFARASNWQKPDRDLVSQPGEISWVTSSWVYLAISRRIKMVRVAVAMALMAQNRVAASLETYEVLSAQYMHGMSIKSV